MVEIWPSADGTCGFGELQTPERPTYTRPQQHSRHDCVAVPKTFGGGLGCAWSGVHVTPPPHAARCPWSTLGKCTQDAKMHAS